MSPLTTDTSLSAWLATPVGRYMLAWERERFAETVADLFGFNALQLGLPELPALAANRMPHRWLAVPEALEPHEAAAAAGVALVTHAAALPFPANSLDLVVLPHTLEFSADPHAVLREVERVLVPEGRVVVAGFNPASWWGWRQWWSHSGWQRRGTHPSKTHPCLPEVGEFIAPWRLRDWLRLLSFELDSVRYGCYRPAVRNALWLQRCAWMDRWGPKWWPLLGAVYFMVAVKRVRGMHMLGPAWKPSRAVAVPVAVTQKPSLQRGHVQHKEFKH